MRRNKHEERLASHGGETGFVCPNGHCHPSRAVRRWGALVLILICTVLLGLAAYPVLSGWTRVPVEAHLAAEAAILAAREAGAPRWAADQMAEAEGTLRANMAAERLQATRILFFRDFRQVEEGLRRAEARAREAATRAQERLAELSSESIAAIQAAELTISRADRAAQQMPFPRAGRILLQSARFHLDEARILFESAEHEDAIQRAELAGGEARAACKQAIPLASRFTDAEQVRTWRRWIDETIAASRQSGQYAIVILKEKNLLNLYRGGKLVSSYEADMGRNSLVPKRGGGDAATPEGRYRITSKKGRGQSKYYKALLLNYPNDEDRRRFEKAKRDGQVSSRARLGGLIEIHGEGGRGADWTQGCVALSNRDMDSVFSRVEAGTPVTIVGGDGRGGAFSDMLPVLTAPDAVEKP